MAGADEITKEAALECSKAASFLGFFWDFFGSFFGGEVFFFGGATAKGCCRGYFLTT